ncbi:MAG: RecX family transcriptional regulator [Burkholderiaceae bacterium]
MPLTPAGSLKSRALQLLALRDHSRAELRRKLAAHADRAERDARSDDCSADVCADHDGASPAPQVDRGVSADVEALLDWLEANRFLSDERFVESRVHARITRFGNARIRLELAQHHAVLSPDAERRLRESELERARAVLARKYDPAATDPASRARQSRFLAGRGFSAEVVARVLREAARAPNGAEALRDDD